MSWITDHARVWRIIALVLLLVALLGPWAHDRINVPAEYPCSAPFVRLEGDFCGLPLSGMWMLYAVGSEFINIISGLVTGSLALAESGRGLMIVLLALVFLLPAVSTLLMIWWGHRRRLQIFHIGILFLAVILMLWAFSAASMLPMSRLLGPWLYIGSVLMLLILEIVVFASRSRLNPAR